MNRRIAAAHIGIIHEVIVEQRVVMIGFQGNGRRKDTLGIFLVEIIAEQHQRGAYALAPHRQHVFNRIIESLGPALIRQVVEILINHSQNFISSFHILFLYFKVQTPRG